MSVPLHYEQSGVTLYHCDARSLPLEDGSVQCCVTSPPYWGLRDYGTEGQLGLEATPEEYVERMVEVFREMRRVLREDGTLWLNLGDSYAGSGKGPAGNLGAKHNERHLEHKTGGIVPEGLKPKDLVGIPWRVAFALQADGWWLRSDIVWHKPNPMPESVRDRPTKAHEYIFLLSKSARYYYDADAIKERGSWEGQHRNIVAYVPSKMPGAPPNVALRKHDKQRGHGRRHAGFNDRWDALSKAEQCSVGRNARSVWTVPTQPYPEAHFAVFPPSLIKPCILAGCPAGGTVLDPFVGSGTTAFVAKELGRRAVGCDLHADYLDLARKRLAQEVLPLGVER